LEVSGIAADRIAALRSLRFGGCEEQQVETVADLVGMSHPRCILGQADDTAIRDGADQREERERQRKAGLNFAFSQSMRTLVACRGRRAAISMAAANARELMCSVIATNYVLGLVAT